MRIHRIVLMTIVCGAVLSAPVFARRRARTKPFNDRDFVNMAAQAEMLQAHIGEMANTHSQQPGVRDLGGQISRQKISSYNELSMLAAKLGIAIPKGIDKGGNRTIARLDHLSGTAFDREFVKEESATAQREVAAFQRASQEAQNPGLKQYAAGALPNLKLNYQETQDFEHYHLAKR
jgi:putative membrane protein